ncbi:GNAT family N-acetyltransferase [Candidatus Uhrbacteria bacterium]|nr:GNAT family N-acetyltransferase [Candidatus Uhrbacteria bacterium]
MQLRLVTNAEHLPEEMIEFKRHHFQDVFSQQWKRVWEQSSLLSENEEVLICEINGRVAGWVSFQKQVYYLKFRGFAVHPHFRGCGVSRMLMSELTRIGIDHHKNLMATGQKPADIRLMFLKSSVYLDVQQQGEAFSFGKFLKNEGFKAYSYNKNEIDQEERVAIEVYQDLYPEFIGCLKVFKLPIIDDGIHFKNETKKELLRLVGKDLEVVIQGLNVKLNNYGRSGRVSYRYDLCPICAYMGSSEQNDDACKRCPIFTTCLEPFRETARFKEDYEISYRYFTAMLKFLLNSDKKG